MSSLLRKKIPSSRLLTRKLKTCGLISMTLEIFLKIIAGNARKEKNQGFDKFYVETAKDKITSKQCGNLKKILLPKMRRII